MNFKVSKYKVQGEDLVIAKLFVQEAQNCYQCFFLPFNDIGKFDLVLPLATTFWVDNTK